MSHLILLVFSMLLPAITQDAPTSASPKVHKIAVGGEGSWDYLTVDSAARRLYVSRGNRVTVLNLDTEDVVGELADTPGIHGIAVVPELGKGFTSNGRDSSVTVFDLKTLKPINKIKAQRRARRDPLRPVEQAGDHLQPRHQRRDLDRPGLGEGRRHDRLRGRARGGRRRWEGAHLRQHPEFQRGG